MIDEKWGGEENRVWDKKRDEKLLSIWKINEKIELKKKVKCFS